MSPRYLSITMDVSASNGWFSLGGAVLGAFLTWLRGWQDIYNQKKERESRLAEEQSKRDHEIRIREQDRKWALEDRAATDRKEAERDAGDLLYCKAQIQKVATGQEIAQAIDRLETFLQNRPGFLFSEPNRSYYNKYCNTLTINTLKSNPEPEFVKQLQSDADGLGPLTS